MVKILGIWTQITGILPVRAIRSDWMTGQVSLLEDISKDTNGPLGHTRFFLLGLWWLFNEGVWVFGLAVRPVTSSRNEKPPISWSDLKSRGQLKDLAVDLSQKTAGGF